MSYILVQSNEMEYAKHMNQKLRIEYILSFKNNGMYHAKYSNMSVFRRGSRNFRWGDDMDEEKIGRGLGTAVGPQRVPGAEPAGDASPIVYPRLSVLTING
jgi:hypothetical protein